MAVRVSRGVKSRLREYRDGIVLQIRDASDTAAAAGALADAAAEIANLDDGWESGWGLGPGDRNGPKYVSRVMPAASGPLIVIDASGTSDDLVLGIPPIVIRHLEQAGVAHAIVDFPASADGLVLNEVPLSVELRMYPPPPPLERLQRSRSEVPSQWIEEAAAWVEQAADGSDLLGHVIVQFPLPSGDALDFLGRCRTQRSSAVLVGGDPAEHIRAVGGFFQGFRPHMAIAGGGPATTDDEVRATMDELIQIARRLAPTIGYAFISIEARFLLGAHRGTEWSFLAGGAPTEYVEKVCDELVFDAFPYQVLGPGHLDRLSRRRSWYGRSRLIATRPVAGGRAELHIGDVECWLPGSPKRSHIQEKGRKMLMPCLVGRAEALAVMDDRRTDDSTRPTSPQACEWDGSRS